MTWLKECWENKVENMMETFSFKFISPHCSAQIWCFCQFFFFIFGAEAAVIVWVTYFKHLMINSLSLFPLHFVAFCSYWYFNFSTSAKFFLQLQSMQGRTAPFSVFTNCMCIAVVETTKGTVWCYSIFLLSNTSKRPKSTMCLSVPCAYWHPSSVCGSEPEAHSSKSGSQLWSLTKRSQCNLHFHSFTSHIVISGGWSSPGCHGNWSQWCCDFMFSSFSKRPENNVMWLEAAGKVRRCIWSWDCQSFIKKVRQFPEAAGHL